MLITASLLSLVLVWYIVPLTQLHVTVNTDGILLHNYLSRKTYCADWKQFAVAYCLHDLKGHHYLLFATHIMEQTEQKKTMRTITRLRIRFPKLSEQGNICIRVDRYLDRIKYIIDGAVNIVG